MTEQIAKLGTVGDKVKVKSGYARNYLFPNKLALRATKENLAYFESQKAELIKKNDAKKSDAKKIFEKINEVTCNIIQMASDEGKLYGSVMTKDVAESLVKKFKIDIKKSMVIMDKAIREVGIYPVKIRVHPEYLAVVNICIAQSDAAAKALISSAKKSEEKAKAKPIENAKTKSEVEDKTEEQIEVKSEKD